MATAMAIARPITDEEIASHLHVTSELAKAFPTSQKTKSWTAVNIVARAHYQAFVSTSPREPLLPLRTPQVAPAKPENPKNSLRAEWPTRTFPDVLTLVKHYESVIAPALGLTAEINEINLEIYGLNDILKLKKHSAEILQKKKERLYEVQAKLKILKEKRASYVKDAFDTPTFNSLINVMRLCGENDEHAYLYSLRLLDDMTICEVPFDNTTQMLLKNIAFGDEPGDDSDMLFAFVEFPEMGEVSLTKEPVAKVCDDVIDRISQRHGIAVTEGLHLKDKSTHPMLPRTPDDQK
jgi:hypothetical protein